MKEWVEIIIGLGSIGSALLSGLVTWLVVVRYRLPQLERRVQTLENGASAHGLKDSEAAPTLVRKQELYHPDGRPIYMHRSDCDGLREGCTESRCAELEQINAKLDRMEAGRTKARTQMIAFMTAVKEKLELKFNVPEDCVNERSPPWDCPSRFPSSTRRSISPAGSSTGSGPRPRPPSSARP
jgi:hypothetical protein